ncbi:MAG: tetratricopeptide repeat protein [Phycisphaeraceae bacterium]|nr:tetratricopeptide repeat protein [Phycisphaeraceae bacterium]
MAEQNEEVEPQIPLEPEEPVSPSGSTVPTSWSEVWQMPVLLLGLGLLFLGIYLGRPKAEEFDVNKALDEVAISLKTNQFDQAKAQLEEVYVFLRDASVAARHGRLNMLQGDLIFEQQRYNNWDNAQSHQQIISSYQRAFDAGQQFDEAHVIRWAETLAALGRDEEALARLNDLPAGVAERRLQILRQIIERRLGQRADSGAKDILPLLGRFTSELASLPDPAEQRRQDIWATALRADLILEQNPDGTGGDPHAVLDQFLPRKLKMLSDSQGENDLAPLMVPLAEAYQRVGSLDQARKWYALAQEKLADQKDNSLHGRILVGLGQITLASSGDGTEALRYFDKAVRDYPLTAAHIDAIIGLAECKARMDLHAEARDAFAQAVEEVLRLRSGAARQGATRRLVDMVLSRADMAFSSENYPLALDYLTVLEALYAGELPSPVVARLASAHEKLAEQKRQTAAEIKTGAETRKDESDNWKTAYELANQESAAQFKAAGDCYYQNARLAEGGSDKSTFADALWRSAQCYDQAQLWPQAVDRYAEYVQALPEDSRRPAAMRALALAYQVQGNYQAAQAQFLSLLEQFANSPEAYDSLVPLARCYTALNDFDAAKRTLFGVLENHPAITPQSAQYLQALIDLGQLHHKLQEYEPAIARLSQALDIIGQNPKESTAALRFILADAYRQSVEQLDQTATDAMSQNQVQARQNERARRLQQSLQLFDQVITELSEVPESALNKLDKIYFRNAYFYRADCAYDLAHYEQAIELYDIAARKWEQDPASLVALVQIVNAYGQLGQVQQARAADRRAQDHLKRIPEEAFNDPDLPMTRRHWDDWLRWTNELGLFDAAKQARTPTP